jgi:hypothetical protein
MEKEKREIIMTPDGKFCWEVVEEDDENVQLIFNGKKFGDNWTLREAKNHVENWQSQYEKIKSYGAEGLST